ncbi:unnamed protein product [Withania somnifera]
MTNSHIKTNTSFQAHIMQTSEYKTNGLGFTVAEKIDENNPLVEIGSRGTVGSLVLQEIEYFTHKPRQVLDVASNSSYSRPRLESLLMMPSMCSMVDVAECNPPAAISRFTYKNLKTDGLPKFCPYFCILCPRFPPWLLLLSLHVPLLLASSLDVLGFILFGLVALPAMKPQMEGDLFLDDAGA